jgi:hypothetical protein
MMKATAETFWVDRDAQSENYASAVTFGKWFIRAKLTLRHLFLRNIVITKKNSPSIWESFILYQQQKAGVAEQSIKDEFFYGSDYTGRKNIPHKTWKRHSAFLVYRQRVNKNNLHRGLTLKTDDQVEPVRNELSVAETRISFQIKSIKLLPIWATALNDISLIENDMSSLRLMEVRSRVKITAEAA